MNTIIRRTMKLFSIEGNIGSGKSTLIKKLKELGKSVIYLPEPVDIWNTVTDSSGVTIIEKYYSDQKKYAFSFQMMAFITRIKQIRDFGDSDCIVLTERCVYTDREIFAKMLYDSGKIEDVEYSIYLKWFDYFVKDINLSGIIYLRVDPDICSERITKRGRKGETIPIEYLAECHDYHENWIDSLPESMKLVVNGNEKDLFEKIDLFIC